MRMSFVAVLAFFLFGMIFAAPTTDGVQGFTKRDNAGDATFYFQGGAFGACGKQNPDSALIVALSQSFCTGWGSPTCGRRIGITAVNGPAPGTYVEASVVDTCMGCKPNDVDCSTAVFDRLTGGNGRFDVGRFQITWKFLD